MAHDDLPHGAFGRLYGIREQYERSLMFLREAQSSSESRDRFRRLMAAVYFARAMVEIMLEAAERGEVPMSRSFLAKRLRSQLPYHDVIYRLRIHDFHRYGVDEIVDGEALGGPITLVAEGDDDGPGAVGISFGQLRPVVRTTGRSRVEWGRSLLWRGDQVLDVQSQAYVKLTDALDAYLEAAPGVIERFEVAKTEPPDGDPE